MGGLDCALGLPGVTAGDWLRAAGLRFGLDSVVSFRVGDNKSSDALSPALSASKLRNI